MKLVPAMKPNRKARLTSAVEFASSNLVASIRILSKNESNSR